MLLETVLVSAVIFHNTQYGCSSLQSLCILILELSIVYILLVNNINLRLCFSVVSQNQLFFSFSYDRAWCELVAKYT